jgi:hypothetical protein
MRYLFKDNDDYPPIRQASPQSPNFVWGEASRRRRPASGPHEHMRARSDNFGVLNRIRRYLRERFVGLFVVVGALRKPRPSVCGFVRKSPPTSHCKATRIGLFVSFRSLTLGPFIDDCRAILTAMAQLGCSARPVVLGCSPAIQLPSSVFRSKRSRRYRAVAGPRDSSMCGAFRAADSAWQPEPRASHPTGTAAREPAH